MTDRFSEVQIENYPVQAIVRIQNEIDTSIPSYGKKLARLESEMLDEYNPRKGPKILGLQKERHRLHKKLDGEDLMEKVDKIEDLVDPRYFKNFIDFSAPPFFWFESCKRGTEVFRILGGYNLPKKMRTISRADLSKERPAVNGKLTYHSEKFKEELDDLF